MADKKHTPSGLDMLYNTINQIIEEARNKVVLPTLQWFRHIGALGKR